MPRYKKTFLKQVILRFDFARIAALQTNQDTPFTHTMTARYPEVTTRATAQFSMVMASPGSPPNLQQQVIGWLRVHKAEGAARSVTLAPDFLTIEYGEGAYKEFGELREQVSFVLNSFRQVFGDLQFTRIGLRYVNEIILSEGSPQEWEGLINPQMVTSVKAGMVAGFRMARSLHQLVALKDDVSVILNYGIHNPDFPNPVARRQFILDLDCYISSLVEAGEAEQRIRDVNSMAEELFEHSIGEDLRDIMEKVQ